MKKETTSKGFYRIYKEIDYPKFDILSFKIGVEWQQEKSYSEEEVLKFLINCPTNTEKKTIEWFNKFKNK